MPVHVLAAVPPAGITCARTPTVLSPSVMHTGENYMRAIRTDARGPQSEHCGRWPHPDRRSCEAMRARLPNRTLARLSKATLIEPPWADGNVFDYSSGVT